MEESLRKVVIVVFKLDEREVCVRERKRKAVKKGEKEREK